MKIESFVLPEHDWVANNPRLEVNLNALWARP